MECGASLCRGRGEGEGAVIPWNASVLSHKAVPHTASIHPSKEDSHSSAAERSQSSEAQRPCQEPTHSILASPMGGPKWQGLVSYPRME